MIKEKNNATCAICGKKYYMCWSCKDQSRLQPWKIHTDTSEHYKIFQIIHGYSIGVYTKKETQDKLKTVDLSDMKTFLPNIKSVITSILTEDTSEKIEIAVDKINNGDKKIKKRKKEHL